MKFTPALALAAVVAFSSLAQAQISFHPNKLEEQPQLLFKRTTTLTPVDGAAYTMVPACCSTDGMGGPIIGCFGCFADDPVLGPLDAIIDGMENQIGLDIQEAITPGTGEIVLGGDSLECLGDDGSGTGAERFILTLTVRTTSIVNALLPAGLAAGGDAITEAALFAGASAGGTPVPFVAPAFVESGLVDFQDVNGDSLTGDMPIDVPVDVFFQDLMTNPAGDWDGNTGIAFVGLVDDTVFGMSLELTYTSMAKCPTMMMGPCDFPVGDINMDGSVGLLDVQGFVAAILSGDQSICEADINQDGNVDLLDVQDFVALILG